jgi:3-hydroxyacyl-[acyl-carrier-protein] dehydratase
MMSNNVIELTAEGLLERLPHRFPFLLIDRATLFIDSHEGLTPQYIKAHKNVTANEPFFTGHFPEKTILPGVLITEAMAQVTVLFFEKKRGYYLTSIKVRFISPVIPGDQLKIEAVPIKLLSQAGIFKVKAMVKNKVVARGELGVCITDTWI